eukprot:gene5281-18527_t
MHPLAPPAETDTCARGYVEVDRLPEGTSDEQFKTQSLETCQDACIDDEECVNFAYTRNMPVSAVTKPAPCLDHMEMITGWLYDHFCYTLPSRIALDGTNVDTQVPNHTVKCLLLDRCQDSGYFISDMNSSGPNFVPIQDLTNSSTILVIKYLEALGGASSLRPNVLVHAWGKMEGDLMKVFKVEDAVASGMCELYMNEYEPCKVPGKRTTSIRGAPSPHQSSTPSWNPASRLPPPASRGGFPGGGPSLRLMNMT